ncbi:MAG: SPASM domain-containing protein [Acidobacteria bacterium]|nr:SPASM domain-containing protein [Acidobacteriota bacterium]MCI0660441.1 SPASM domain-containing protein [Acidobacteriota bacterium]
MESIYYVATFLCHRSCHHCYEDRFRPYYGADLQRVVDESVNNHARIIENFPERMSYLDLNDCDSETGRPLEKIGRIILAGGEILLDPVRERVLYSALDLLNQKYGNRVKLIVQTTGDLVTEKIVDELLEHHVWQISVSGIDHHHDGLETKSAQQRLVHKLKQIFESRGMLYKPLGMETAGEVELEGRYYSFFGATEESWIGPLWPRGRAHQNEISKATLKDNFCNRWSGALNFLQYRYQGSEVSVEPNGNVYPCCIKTKAQIGNLLEEKLETILDRLTGNPVYEALSMGHPERMGIAHGWTIERFIEASTIRLPSGKLYQNLCIGCDRFHDEVLLPAIKR